jgi:hypothetical protein
MMPSGSPKVNTVRDELTRKLFVPKAMLLFWEAKLAVRTKSE